MRNYIAEGLRNLTAAQTAKPSQADQLISQAEYDYKRARADKEALALGDLQNRHKYLQQGMGQLVETGVDPAIANSYSSLMLADVLSKQGFGDTYRALLANTQGAPDDRVARSFVGAGDAIGENDAFSLPGQVDIRANNQAFDLDKATTLQGMRNTAAAQREQMRIDNPRTPQELETFLLNHQLKQAQQAGDSEAVQAIMGQLEEVHQRSRGLQTARGSDGRLYNLNTGEPIQFNESPTRIVTGQEAAEFGFTPGHSILVRQNPDGTEEYVETLNEPRRGEWTVASFNEQGNPNYTRGGGIHVSTQRKAEDVLMRSRRVIPKIDAALDALQNGDVSQLSAAGFSPAFQNLALNTIGQFTEAGTFDTKSETFRNFLQGLERELIVASASSGRPPAWEQQQLRKAYGLTGTFKSMDDLLVRLGNARNTVDADAQIADDILKGNIGYDTIGRTSFNIFAADEQGNQTDKPPRIGATTAGDTPQFDVDAIDAAIQRKMQGGQ